MVEAQRSTVAIYTAPSNHEAAPYIPRPSFSDAGPLHRFPKRTL